MESAINGRGTVVTQTNDWVELPLCQTSKSSALIPRVVTLNEIPYGSASAFGTSQPGAEQNAVYGGFKANSNTAGEWMGWGDLALQCHVRYGMGGAVHDVYFDWIPGTYQLPPCDFVSVSAVAFAPGVVSYPVGVVIAPGLYQSGMAMTLTGIKVFAAAGSANAPRPYKARAFELWTNSTTVNLTAAGSTGGTRAVRRDYGAQVFIPPWSPVEIAELTSPNITVTVSAAATVTVRWFLSL